MTINPKRTPARQDWLETLSHGPAKRRKSIVGFQCMRLGWTEWVKPERCGELADQIVRQYHERLHKPMKEIK